MAQGGAPAPLRPLGRTLARSRSAVLLIRSVCPQCPLIRCSSDLGGCCVLIQAEVLKIFFLVPGPPSPWPRSRVRTPGTPGCPPPPAPMEVHCRTDL